MASKTQLIIHAKVPAICTLVLRGILLRLHPLFLKSKAEKIAKGYGERGVSAKEAKARVCRSPVSD